MSRNAVTVLKEDGRPPVVYLRSFEDDVEESLIPRSGLSVLFGLVLPSDVRRLPLWQRVIFELHPLRLLRSLSGRVTPTTELQLAGYFREFGPFVAIGKPGEKLATVGADRMYVTNEVWQQTVIDLLNRSKYVVLQAAGTKGFLWEVRTVLDSVEPEKILFCLSNFRERQNDYEDFRLEVEWTTGWKFPRSVGNQLAPLFLFFKADRSPVVHALSSRSPVLWLVLGEVTDLRHTLAAFVDSGRQSDPYQPKRYPGHKLLAFFLFLTVIPTVWAVILWLLLIAVFRLT
jgi:hypothetical protein